MEEAELDKLLEEKRKVLAEAIAEHQNPEAQSWMDEARAKISAQIDRIREENASTFSAYNDFRKKLERFQEEHAEQIANFKRAYEEQRAYLDQIYEEQRRRFDESRRAARRFRDEIINSYVHPRGSAGSVRQVKLSDPKHPCKADNERDQAIVDERVKAVLYDLLEECGGNKSECVRRIGGSDTGLNNWLNKEGAIARMSAESLDKIASAAQMTREEILSGAPSESFGGNLSATTNYLLEAHTFDVEEAKVLYYPNGTDAEAVTLALHASSTLSMEDFETCYRLSDESTKRLVTLILQNMLRQVLSDAEVAKLNIANGFMASELRSMGWHMKEL